MKQIIQYAIAVTIISILAGFNAMHAKADDNFVRIFYDQCGSGGATRIFSNRDHLVRGANFFGMDDCKYKRLVCRAWTDELLGNGELDKEVMDNIRAGIEENCRGLLP